VTDTQNPETFSWKKWITGIFNPLSTAKLSAHYIHLALIIILIICGIKITVFVKNWIFPTSERAITVSQTSGGHVETNPDKKLKFGIINF